MDNIKRVEANFSDKDFFNIQFHSTNLHWPRVINKRKAAEMDRVDRANKGRVDGKKIDRLGIALKDPVIKDLSNSRPRYITNRSSIWRLRHKTGRFRYNIRRPRHSIRRPKYNTGRSRYNIGRPRDSTRRSRYFTERFKHNNKILSSRRFSSSKKLIDRRWYKKLVVER